VAKKTARYIDDFDEIKVLLKDLQLDLKTLTKKFEALCHDPHIAGSKEPSAKKSSPKK
jgi:hypothetical protein